MCSNLSSHSAKIWPLIRVHAVDHSYTLSNVWHPDKAIHAIDEARRVCAATRDGDAEGSAAAMAVSGRGLGSTGTRTSTTNAGADGSGGTSGDSGSGDDGGRVGAPGGSEVLSTTIKLIRCWPARRESVSMSFAGLLARTSGYVDKGSPRSAAAAATAARARARAEAAACETALRNPPFLCCVKIDRLQVSGVRRLDGAVAPRPLQLSIHAPLVLQNTLPIKIGWSLAVPRDEFLRETYGEWDRGPASDPEGASGDDQDWEASLRWSLQGGATLMRMAQRSIKIRAARHTTHRRHASAKAADDELVFGVDDKRRGRGVFAKAGRFWQAMATKHQNRTKKKKGGRKTIVVGGGGSGQSAYDGDIGGKKSKEKALVDVCEGTLREMQSSDVHAVSPRQQWRLTLSVSGYEPSALLLINRGDGLDSSKHLARLHDVIELKPLAGSGENRVLRLHIANRMRSGAVRELTLYAPYWLVNKTCLPLMYREVRLGTGLLNSAHAMQGGRTSHASSTTSDVGGGVPWSRHSQADARGRSASAASVAASARGALAMATGACVPLAIAASAKPSTITSAAAESAIEKVLSGAADAGRVLTIGERQLRTTTSHRDAAIQSADMAADKHRLATAADAEHASSGAVRGEAVSGGGRAPAVSRPRSSSMPASVGTGGAVCCDANGETRTERGISDSIDDEIMSIPPLGLRGSTRSPVALADLRYANLHSKAPGALPTGPAGAGVGIVASDGGGGGVGGGCGGGGGDAPPSETGHLDACISDACPPSLISPRSYTEDTPSEAAIPLGEGAHFGANSHAPVLFSYGKADIFVNRLSCVSVSISEPLRHAACDCRMLCQPTNPRVPMPRRATAGCVSSK